jgi:hypothetical protein
LARQLTDLLLYGLGDLLRPVEEVFPRGRYNGLFETGFLDFTDEAVDGRPMRLHDWQTPGRQREECGNGRADNWCPKRLVSTPVLKVGLPLVE